MPTPPKIAPAALGALTYVTAGSLILVWSGVGAVYYFRHPPQREITYYLGAGAMATGLILLVIGLVIGRVGGAARRADLPPAEPAPPPSPPAPQVAYQPPHISVAPVVVQPPAGQAPGQPPAAR